MKEYENQMKQLELAHLERDQVIADNEELTKMLEERSESDK